MTRETAEFIIYIINEIANINGCSASHVFQVLDDTGCIDNYLMPFYDILHTLGSETVVDDVLEYVQSKGAVI